MSDPDATSAPEPFPDATSAPEPFRCEVGVDGSSAWVRPVGELDLDTVRHVDAELGALRDAGSGDLVLDLRSLTFMDSSGLRLAIRWDAAAREQGFRFAVVPGPEVVQRVFRVTGMDAYLTVADPPPAPAA